jgi:tetratricopeptide (TPR) repeat protein
MYGDGGTFGSLAAKSLWVDVTELKARARSMVVKGRLEKAEVLYRQVLTQVPRDAPAWIRHAETLRRLGRTDEASWSYRTAAGILLSLGYEARAIAALKLALELKPADIDLVSEIIRVEMHRNRRVPPTPGEARPLEPSQVVPMNDLEQKQLALPMLTQPDMRPSAESGIVAAPVAEAPPPLSAPMTDLPPGLPPEWAASGETAPSAPEPLPTPMASPPVRFEVEALTNSAWPQVRRINDREIAIKASASAKWIVITSSAPLDVRFAITLDVDLETPWLE